MKSVAEATRAMQRMGAEQHVTSKPPLPVRSGAPVGDAGELEIEVDDSESVTSASENGRVRRRKGRGERSTRSMTRHGERFPFTWSSWNASHGRTRGLSFLFCPGTLLKMLKICVTNPCVLYLYLWTRKDWQMHSTFCCHCMC